MCAAQHTLDCNNQGRRMKTKYGNKMREAHSITMTTTTKRQPSFVWWLSLCASLSFYLWEICEFRPLQLQTNCCYCCWSIVILWNYILSVPVDCFFSLFSFRLSISIKLAWWFVVRFFFSSSCSHFVRSHLCLAQRMLFTRFISIHSSSVCHSRKLTRVRSAHNLSKIL